LVDDIIEKEMIIVWCLSASSVPVLRYALMTSNVLHLSLDSRDAVEALQHILSEMTSRMIGRMIREETIDERVHCGLHDQTCERTIEEELVLCYAMSLAHRAEVCQRWHVVVRLS